jgi:hypothetical protein
MGWMHGFITRAGEVAHEQDMLELQQAADQKKNLYDFYTKLVDHPDLMEERRPELFQSMQRLLQIPAGKKIPKDLYPESLLSRGRMFYDYNEQSARSAERAALAARREQEETLPGQEASQIRVGYAGQHGTAYPREDITGAEAQGRGASVTSGGLPINPEGSYNYQRYRDASDLLRQYGIPATPMEPLLAEDPTTSGASGVTVGYHRWVDPTTRNVIETPILIDKASGTAQPITDVNGNPINRVPGASYFPNVSGTTTKRNVLTGTSQSERTTARQIEGPATALPPPQSPQGMPTPIPAPPTDSIAPTAPTAPALEGEPTGEPMAPAPGQSPAMVADTSPVFPSPYPQAVATPPPPTTTIIPGMAPTHRSSQEFFNSVAVADASVPKSPFAKTMAELRKASEKMAASPLNAEYFSMEELAAIPSVINETATDARTKAAQESVRDARTGMYNLLNYYPSDFHEDQIQRIKLPSQYAGNREEIQQAIRNLLDNPLLIDDPYYRGEPGIIIKTAMNSVGIPIPAKVGAQQADTASFGLMTLEAIRGLRQLLLQSMLKHNKNIYTGVIQGRLNEAFAKMGAIPWMDTVDRAIAQEIITRIQYFVVMEAKVLMGSRPALAWAQQLKEVSAQPHMRLHEFLGALNGAEFHARNAIKEAAYPRWGARIHEMDTAPNAPYMPGGARVGDIRVKKSDQRMQILRKEKSTGRLVWHYINTADPTTGKLQNTIPDLSPDGIAWDPRARTMGEAGGLEATPRRGQGGDRRVRIPIPPKEKKDEEKKEEEKKGL